MNNVIIINLDKQSDTDTYNITFRNDPTLDELTTSLIVLDELIEHNFTKDQFIRSYCRMYHRIVDMEEVERQC